MIIVKVLGKVNNALGIAFVAIAVIYWFDLDDKIVSKVVPKMQKFAAQIDTKN